jgi:hypothetical protein
MLGEGVNLPLVHMLCVMFSIFKAHVSPHSQAVFAYLPSPSPPFSGTMKVFCVDVADFEQLKTNRPKFTGRLESWQEQK